MGQIMIFPASPETRLRAALRSLEAALAAQHVALSDFRSNVRGLRSAVGDLGGTLGTFRQELDGVQHALADACTSARQLERTADAALKA